MNCLLNRRNIIVCIRNNSNLQQGDDIELFFNDYNNIIPIDFVLCQYKNTLAQLISLNLFGAALCVNNSWTLSPYSLV